MSILRQSSEIVANIRSIDVYRAISVIRVLSGVYPEIFSYCSTDAKTLSVQKELSKNSFQFSAIKRKGTNGSRLSIPVTTS